MKLNSFKDIIISILSSYILNVQKICMSFWLPNVGNVNKILAKMCFDLLVQVQRNVHIFLSFTLEWEVGIHSKTRLTIGHYLVHLKFILFYVLTQPLYKYIII